MHETKDSYQEFLEYFKIDKESFFEWGISSTIFPSTYKVEVVWENLKKRILSNQNVYIRGYGINAHGTQLYTDLYAQILNNTNVKKDPRTNTIPHKLMKSITEYKHNENIYNYQVSHIWGRTKNVFMFEAPWNLCLTPKIIDPFTGHETKGIWPKEYQRMFRSKAMELYQPFIDDYNQLLIRLDVKRRLEDYCLSLKGLISEKERIKFSKDATKELAPILPEKVDSKQVRNFATKWTKRFKDPNITYYELIDNLHMADDCNALGFEMDGGHAFYKFYGDAVYDYFELKKIIDNVTDITLLGSAIYSQWRSFNHWEYDGSVILEPKNRYWFILALDRLAELCDENLARE